MDRDTKRLRPPPETPKQYHEKPSVNRCKSRKIAIPQRQKQKPLHGE